MRILCVGPQWRGSNAGGLFKAFSRSGCLIEVVDEFYYFSFQSKATKLKVIEKLIRPWQAQEYNNAIKRQVSVFQPEIVFVYKGAFVHPDTLLFARNKGAKLVLFYPDVSLTNHGGNIPQCIPLYDLIFTTKTFGITDLKNMYGVKNIFFVPHGYDPEVHKPLPVTEKDRAIFGCDASFIGTWSPKKEQWLAYLKQQLPDINLKVWGAQWNKVTTSALNSSIMGIPVTGDLYAAAIQSSLINLGILSEQVVGASSGDLITSRTFHITGVNGFLMHERNEESVLYYEEGKEAAFFDGPEEMTAKTKEFLSKPELREQIKEAGHKRAVAEHSLDARAKTIIDQIQLL